MSAGWYVRDSDGAVRGPVDVDEWSEWASQLPAEDRNRVALDEWDAIRVSTVFLGLDHSYTGPPPILFETMIFGGGYDEYQWRYPDERAARAGHAAVVAALRSGVSPVAAIDSQRAA